MYKWYTKIIFASQYGFMLHTDVFLFLFWWLISVLVDDVAKGEGMVGGRVCMSGEYVAKKKIEASQDLISDRYEKDGIADACLVVFNLEAKNREDREGNY